MIYDCIQIWNDNNRAESLEIPAEIDGLPVTDLKSVAVSDIKSIKIPPTIEKIGADAFSYCDSLDDVYISDISAWCEIDFEDSPFYYASNLYLDNELVKELVIPSGTKKYKQICIL